MTKYIIKPLDFSNTSDIDELTSKLVTTSILIYCYGAPKVGKTALCYKLLHTILKQGHTDYNPFFVGTDKKEETQYWNDKIKSVSEDYSPYIPAFKEPKMYNLLKVNNAVSFLLKWILLQVMFSNHNNNFLIIDDLDTLRNEYDVDTTISLVEQALKWAKSNKITIFITCKKKYEFIGGLNYDIPVEYWKLEKAEYLNDILEFGGTRLTIQS